MTWEAHCQLFIFAPQAVRGSFGWGSEGQASPALPMAQHQAPEDREEEALALHLPAAEAPPNAVALRWAVEQHWA